MLACSSARCTAGWCCSSAKGSSASLRVAATSEGPGLGGRHSAGARAPGFLRCRHRVHHQRLQQIQRRRALVYCADRAQRPGQRLGTWAAVPRPGQGAGDASASACSVSQACAAPGPGAAASAPDRFAHAHLRRDQQRLLVLGHRGFELAVCGQAVGLFVKVMRQAHAEIALLRGLHALGDFARLFPVARTPSMASSANRASASKCAPSRRRSASCTVQQAGLEKVQGAAHGWRVVAVGAAQVAARQQVLVHAHRGCIRRGGETGCPARSASSEVCWKSVSTASIARR